jgi:Fic family protein
MQLPPTEPLQSFAGCEGALTAELSRLDDLMARYGADQAAGRVLANTTEAIRVEVTYHSNAMEGNTLTLRETQLVIEGLAPGNSKSMREIYEARNHDRAVRMIEEWAKKPVVAISEQELLNVHRVVLADIDEREAGNYRSGRVLIAGSRFVPPGPQKFDELMPRALEEEGGLHAAIAAAQLHYNLVGVHPFADGNGRTARLMMNYHLLRRGYPWTIIDVAERPAYMAALEEANAGRCGPFAAFVVRSVARSVERVLG